jgi:hypothetical protein
MSLTSTQDVSEQQFKDSVTASTSGAAKVVIRSATFSATVTYQFADSTVTQTEVTNGITNLTGGNATATITRTRRLQGNVRRLAGSQAVARVITMGTFAAAQASIAKAQDGAKVATRVSTAAQRVIAVPTQTVSHVSLKVQTEVQGNSSVAAPSKEALQTKLTSVTGKNVSVATIGSVQTTPVTPAPGEDTSAAVGRVELFSLGILVVGFLATF